MLPFPPPPSLTPLSPLVRPVIRPFQRFFQQESTGSIMLVIGTVLALVWANTIWSDAYFEIRHMAVGGQSLEFWVNDVLMSIFFLLVGLEIRRELTIGELSSPRQAALPFVAAVGGMVMPALLFAIINPPGSTFAGGWGIPTVTDIAFSLAVISLLGDRVPLSLKVFLTALAIVDDVGAVLVIALFYSTGIEGAGILGAGAIVAMAIGIDRWERLHRHAVIYPILLALGMALWFSVWYAGVHPTLAGVLFAFLLPVRRDDPDDDNSPGMLERLEHGIHPWVSFGILPLFAFINAGVVIEPEVLQKPMELMTHPVTLGIVLGLVVGKPLGIGLFSWLAIRLGLAEAPQLATRFQLFAVGMLGGIGFTMSLFISHLFVTMRPSVDLDMYAKMGILISSLLAAVLGLAMLWPTRCKGEPCGEVALPDLDEATPAAPEPVT